MDIEIKELYKYFSTTVKASEYFCTWKKSGLRKFKNKNTELNVSVEIEQMKGTGPKWISLSLTVSASIPSDYAPIFDMYGKKRQEGTLLYQWSIRSEKNSDPRNTWILKSDADVVMFKAELKEIISEELPLLIESICTPDKLLAFILKNNHIGEYLPLILTLKSKKEVQNALIDYVASFPDPRPDEKFWKWCAINELFSRDIIRRLKIASLQSTDDYIEQFRIIHSEIC